MLQPQICAKVNPGLVGEWVVVVVVMKGGIVQCGTWGTCAYGLVLGGQMW